MTKKDPYYTYTDYWPCKPERKFNWALPGALLLLVVITLVIALAVVGALALPALPL